jgi:hypothetical protein
VSLRQKFLGWETSQRKTFFIISFAKRSSSGHRFSSILFSTISHLVEEREERSCILFLSKCYQKVWWFLSTWKPWFVFLESFTTIDVSVFVRTGVPSRLEWTRRLLHRIVLKISFLSWLLINIVNTKGDPTKAVFRLEYTTQDNRRVKTCQNSLSVSSFSWRKSNRSSSFYFLKSLSRFDSMIPFKSRDFRRQFNLECQGRDQRLHERKGIFIYSFLETFILSWHESFFQSSVFICNFDITQSSFSVVTRL